MVRGGEKIIRVMPPAKKDIITVRILICLALIAMVLFTGWFFGKDHMGFAPLSVLLTTALIFKLVKMVHEWYHYWSPSVPTPPESNRLWKVDVLTTACPGEPREMIIRTLKAMVAITYPHTNYLCDEGNDPELKEICDQLGVRHVTRTIKKDAKAGNINNALQQADGEICVVLDPDHEPVPEFLDRVLPYFEDEQIGFVQCVQGYHNQDESFVARGAAEQTYHFYGPMMMCMNTYGTVQAIGANCTFRRSALDSIGGHAAGLSEDMHTAMQLHAKGWKSVYVPEILTRGLVPATLSSYYKQQLKWSRGTFELLFRTYPSLFKNFTWRQRIHYFTIPLYFLFGLINLIDLLVPMLALTLAQVPWELPLDDFAMIFVPLCFLSLIIRLYAQRWLLEDHERGFHLAGGVLRLATWWIFLVGFIYTIFRVRVPYIPTPKEDEHQNFMRLSIPNIIVVVIGGLLVWYGLSIDWTPYSIAMASYAAMSGGMLGLAVLLSQQKFLNSLRASFSNFTILQSLTLATSHVGGRTQQALYRFMQNGPLMLLAGMSMLLLSYNSINETIVDGNSDGNKQLGGFYVGTHGNGLPEVPRHITPLQQAFTPGTLIPDSARLAYIDRRSMPFLQWISDKSGITCHQIVRGEFDSLLARSASIFRTYREPVLISFSTNNAAEAPEDFQQAWQYLYTFFNELGINNLTWVWCPADAQSANSYPGEKFVDWIGVSCLNYAENPKEKDWYTFSQIYEPLRKAYGPYAKPVIITHLGSVAGAYQSKWLADAAQDISEKYAEINAALVFHGRIDAPLPSLPGTFHTLNFDIPQQGALSGLIELSADQVKNPAFVPSLPFTKAAQNYSSPFIKGNPGSFTLTVNQEPVYIRGVAYNTAHDWRDGHMPLTRRQLENDFSLIKEMGSNTIRRYGTGVYDRNILNIADEFDLNVLFGFWFDPKIDYHANHQKVAEYLEEVEETVLRYKDHPAVLAWGVGNESWGLLKHTYARPYLIKVRLAYVKMIEQMAQRIHAIDPTRPVITCLEHEEYQLPGELTAFRDNAPSVDVIGVNSYYKEQIRTLNHVMWQFDSLRPYIISEFGPNGYWDPKYNRVAGDALLEQTDREKADWYKEQWDNYVISYKGHNLGGFAYCWHDRMEGTITWFGLTDMKGRAKPSYFALRELWTSKQSPEIPTIEFSAPENLKPGQAYEITALNVPPGASCQWLLLKDEYLDEVDNLEPGAKQASILLTVPREPSNYRLYVSVSDEKSGWTTTNSLPVPVRKSPPLP